MSVENPGQVNKTRASRHFECLIRFHTMTKAQIITARILFEGEGGNSCFEDVPAPTVFTGQRLIGTLLVRGETSFDLVHLVLRGERSKLQNSTANIF